MTKRNGDDISIRLGVDGRDFLKDMKAIGEAGERQLKKLAAEGKKTTDEYKKLEKELDGVRSGIEKLEDAQSDAAGGANKLVGRLEKMGISLEDIQGRAGPVGSLLSGIGARGLVAAGGVAAVTAAIAAMVKILEAADRKATELQAFRSDAASTGFSVEDYRAFELQLIRNGQSLGEFTSATERFRSRIVDASNGQGELFQALKDTHPELIKNLVGSRNQSEALFILAKALSEETDEVERARIAKAALDAEGVKLLPTLKVLADKGMVGVREEARKAGVALTDDLIEPYKDLEKANKELALSFDEQLTRALKNVSGPASEAKGILAGLLGDVNRWLELQGGDYSVVPLQGLRDELVKLQEEYDRLGQKAKDGSLDLIGGEGDRYEKLAKRLDSLRAEIVRREGEAKDPFAGSTASKTVEDDTPSGETPEQRVARLLKEAQARINGSKELAALEAQAAAELVKQGDLTLAIEQAKKRINELVKAGLLDQEQAAKALEIETEALRKRTPQYKQEVEQRRVLADIEKYLAGHAEKAADQKIKDQREINKLLNDELEEVRKIQAVEERRAQAVAELQRRHKDEIAYIVGDRAAMNEAEVNYRAQEYMAADPNMTEMEARRRAKAEIAAIRMAEVQAATGDVFADALVTAANNGDWKSVLANGIRDAANEGLRDAAKQLYNMVFQLLGLGNGGGTNVSIFGGGDIFETLGGLFGGNKAADAATEAAASGAGSFLSSFFPRFHNGNPGGIGPQEYLAVIQNNEPVGKGTGGGSLTFAPVLNAQGADRESVDELRVGLQAMWREFSSMQKDLPGRIRATVYDLRQKDGF